MQTTHPRNLRTKVLPLAHVHRAIARGTKVADAWAATRQNGYREWQAESIEILLLPGLWQRVLAKMRLDGQCPYRTEPPRRCEYNGLPGYLLDGWNGPPRESWPASHSPGNCWNGLVRNYYVSVVDLLRAACYETAHMELIERELRQRWAIELR